MRFYSWAGPKERPLSEITDCCMNVTCSPGERSRTWSKCIRGVKAAEAAPQNDDFCFSVSGHGSVPMFAKEAEAPGNRLVNIMARQLFESIESDG